LSYSEISLLTSLRRAALVMGGSMGDGPLDGLVTIVHRF
jgi:hypothetical protein